MNHQQLTQIFESGATSNPIDEILLLTSLIQPSCNLNFLHQLHEDISQIYSGNYPGFQGSNTRYHNLQHTHSVVLATVRLLHGLNHSGQEISPHTLKLALFCAYFHDTGMIVTNKDYKREETAVVHIRDHEARSISNLSAYLALNQLDDPQINEYRPVIQCTNLTQPPGKICFTSAESKLSGYVLGTADILAQMADRYYLERLPFLFEEHYANGINVHNSAVELMKETTSFYKNTVAERLEKAFAGLAGAMQTHFNERWQIDENLYSTNITKNLTYLNTVLERCENRLECLTTYFKRVPPT